VTEVGQKLEENLVDEKKEKKKGKADAPKAEKKVTEKPKKIEKGKKSPKKEEAKGKDPKGGEKAVIMDVAQTKIKIEEYLLKHNRPYSV
jgi:hypothetical protein